jgi:hypothetical protein
MGTPITKKSKIKNQPMRLPKKTGLNRDPLAPASPQK